MLDTSTPIAPCGLQRTRGSAGVSFADGRLRDLYQAGSAKAMLPRTHGPVPEVVFLNTAGGLTGGDRLSFEVTAAAGCDLVATTQTAERAYASADGRAQVDVHLQAGPGARLDWLPQETILYDRAALDRRTRIDLAGDAQFLMAEIVVLGRAAMAETLRDLSFTDRRIVTRDGTIQWLDPFGLDDAALAAADQTARLARARAVATLALLAPGAPNRLPGLRAMLDGATPEGVQVAASAWGDRLILRAHAPDAFPLRRLIAAALTHLRGRPLPRVWQI